MVAALFVSIGCEDTNENLVQERGKAVNVTMSNVVPSFFIDGNLENSYVNFDLSLPEGERVDRAELVLVYGDKTVTLISNLQFPSPDITITAMEVVEALGLSIEDVTQEDIFELYVLTTKDGKTTRSTAALWINVTCEFDPALTLGKYDYESDEDNWDTSGSVRLEADPGGDPYKLYFVGAPLAENDGFPGLANKVELIIDPDSYTVSGSKTIVAANIWSYTNLAFQAVSGSFSACDGNFSVVFEITVAQGSFGTYVFNFTRLDEDDLEPDYSAEIDFMGHYTNPEGRGFALAEVQLGADVEYAKVALIAGDMDTVDEQDVIDGIEEGSIKSVEIAADGSVQFACQSTGVFTYVVVTYADDEAQEVTFVTFELPPFCTLVDPSILAGTFDFESEDFEVEGSGLIFEADAIDEYKIFIDGVLVEDLEGNGNRIELNIDPVDYTISGPKVIIADDLSEWDEEDITNFAFEPFDGFFSPCTGIYYVTFKVTDDEDLWGFFEYVFTPSEAGSASLSKSSVSNTKEDMVNQGKILAQGSFSVKKNFKNKRKNLTPNF